MGISFAAPNEIKNGKENLVITPTLALNKVKKFPTLTGQDLFSEIEWNLIFTVFDTSQYLKINANSKFNIFD